LANGVQEEAPVFAIQEDGLAATPCRNERLLACKVNPHRLPSSQLPRAITWS
jgi:hypothetical protein